MKDIHHTVFVLFLSVVGMSVLIALNIKGLAYYLTPVEARPFLSEYATMKPSGRYSHGLAIIGTLMIVVGVATYSTRKRMRSLWRLGKLSRWLEFHIFNCLVGPILVVYHTTFKVGGIAAITFWTMLSVVASGIIGRYLYAQIPRNLNGSEMTLEEIETRMQHSRALLEASPPGKRILEVIDQHFALYKQPTTMKETLATLLHLQRMKWRIKHEVQQLIAVNHLHTPVARALSQTANERASLLQKTVVLSQTERFFYYWHVIHLPFAVIMFLTLLLHVTVVVLLGYTWIL